MKTPIRSIRRAAKERMKARARRIFPDWSKADRNADNLKVCDGPCCQNPRRWFKRRVALTTQELRAVDATEQELCEMAKRK